MYKQRDDTPTLPRLVGARLFSQWIVNERNLATNGTRTCWRFDRSSGQSRRLNKIEDE